MNEAIQIARDGIERAELYLRFAGEQASIGSELTETRQAVLMLAGALKELTGAVEAQERRIMRLERNR